ncbi:pentatricopeptide repeat-containing protein At1g19720 [Phalaenopsis equestris]|uniref:pentatricopeptide repeat-containing protein At1g19720 n=1 Tax=Phalaenopsis equestris TaxID=78828 RepID=UPI0009E27392|nr:pentatricopeptide repeat-containing protein At1g19720 [Phalaenopsis equestris]
MMENPFFSCKSQNQILIPFFKPQISNNLSSQISPPTQNLKAASSEAEPPPTLPPQTGRPGERKLLRLSRAGKLQEAVSALHPGTPITTRTYLSLLQACIDSNSVEAGRILHSSFPYVKNPNPFVETKLVSMYAKCGDLDNARKVFEKMRQRNLFTWSAMIGGCGRDNQWEEVVGLFHHMVLEGINPDAFLLPKILQACANIEDVVTGKLLHSLTIRLGFLEESHVGNSLLNMYAKCGDLITAKKFFDKLDVRDRVSWNSIISAHCHCGRNDEALKLFEQMRNEGIEPCLITWNILISSYSQCGKPKIALELMKKMESSKIVPDVFTWTCIISGLLQNKKMNQSLDLFQQMLKSDIEPNNMTVACAISACATLKYLKNGRELHCYAIKNGGAANLLVINSLVDLYSKCWKLEDAERIFDAIDKKDVFTWNSLIGGYMQAGYCGKAHELFTKMETLGLQDNPVTWNVMISGYIQNREEEQAVEHFQKMEAAGVRRNAASWNALISGFLQNGEANKAFRVFRQMQFGSEKSNSITILSILPACANLVSAWKVKEIHAYVLRSGLNHDLPILNSLIDIYSKSGDLTSARVSFNTLHARDYISWNSVIAGCVFHGCSQPAQELFHRMENEGVKPNLSIYTSLIRSYGFDGLVNDGKELFMNITEQNFSPGMEFYAAMVELFGRSKRLVEAYSMIKEMPVEPDSTVWNALLTAARYCGNVKLASFATENLIKLEPKNPILQCLSSSLQAICGSSSEIPDMKKPLKESDEYGFHSCCWMEDRCRVYTVFVGDRMVESVSTKLVELRRIEKEIKANIASITGTRLDIEEELEDDDEMHCERKAILYSLVSGASLKVIRIVKNVRMCAKCHGTAKLVSKLYGRIILIKDRKCLHYFRDGECSCKDYW